MSDWDEEIDEELYEDEDVDLSEEDEVTPQEEAFMQGYDDADIIEHKDGESKDFDDVGD